MKITAKLTLEGEVFVASLSDGQELREIDLDRLVDKLIAIGITADDVQTPDWRAGDAALMRGQIVAVKWKMRTQAN